MTTRRDVAGEGRGPEDTTGKSMSEGRGTEEALEGDPGRPNRPPGSKDPQESLDRDLPPIDPARLAAAEQLGRLAAEAAVSRKGLDAVLLKVTGRCSYTDYILVVEAESDRQVEALSGRIQRTVREAGAKPLGVEGRGEGGWVLLDFGDLVVHVFRRDMRSFYDIEGLWHDAPRVDLADLLSVAGDASSRDESAPDEWDDEEW